MRFALRSWFLERRHISCSTRRLRTSRWLCSRNHKWSVARDIVFSGIESSSRSCKCRKYRRPDTIHRQVDDPFFGGKIYFRFISTSFKSSAAKSFLCLPYHRMPYIQPLANIFHCGALFHLDRSSLLASSCCKWIEVLQCLPGP